LQKPNRTDDKQKRRICKQTYQDLCQHDCFQCQHPKQIHLLYEEGKITHLAQECATYDKYLNITHIIQK
jgi:hypothetical protein